MVVGAQLWQRPLRAALITVLALASAMSGVVLGQEDTLLAHLMDLEKEHASLCSMPEGRSDLRSTIDTIVKELDTSAGGTAGSQRVDALNHLLFDHLAIKASQDLKDPCNLLPSDVLERKQGYCVGIAALYLLLAGRLDLPIYAVATPSHVFLRYDDGAVRVNIETLRGGAGVPDEQYIREQKIPEESIRRGIFMRNLTTDEFLAQVLNNLGVVYSERKDYDAAAGEYERALDLDPRLPAALYNWGNDLLRQGVYRRAARLFSKSLRLFPNDIWALNNRGLAYMNMEKREKARRDFEAALAMDPGFEAARKNLGRLAAEPSAK